MKSGIDQSGVVEPPAGAMKPPAAAAVWSSGHLTDPHRTPDKADRIRAMFAAIAPAYDLNNHLLSMGIDHLWRRAAVAAAGVKPDEVVADIACGTGDLSFAFAAARPKRVIGVDFCHPMICGALKKTLQRKDGTPVGFSDGDATRLPLADASVDIVSIAFGLRNVDRWTAAIAEFYRVLRPGGRLIILEFTTPERRLMRGVFQVYFQHVLPAAASLISRDRSGAYYYLPRSVGTFAGPDRICSAMRDAGFTDVGRRSLTFGICACYRGVRRG